MTTYRKLPGLVEAQQVPDTRQTATQDELTAVAQWCGGKLNMFVNSEGHGETLIRIPTLDGPMLAFASDFIVKDGDSYTVVTAELFAQSYVVAE